jgi:hypothetical protein
MSDSINPNQRLKSSLMNNATRSESLNSIPTAVNCYGTMNFNNIGSVNFGIGSASSSRSHSPSSFSDIPLPNLNG